MYMAIIISIASESHTAGVSVSLDVTFVLFIAMDRKGEKICEKVCIK